MCRYCTTRRATRKKRMKSFGDRLDECHYLYLKEILHMFQKSEPLSQFQERIKCVLTLRNIDDIVSLRNAVVHPKPLVSGVFPLSRLMQVHRLVKDLISECKRETTYNM